jgi:erythritol kinase (D-erythritol 1-phosphate-forming)
MGEPYLLGIDIGTSVVKSVLFDHGGHEVAIGRRTPALLRPHAGWSEADMEALWLDVADTVREVVHSEARQEGEVRGIGLSGTACGLWLVDGGGDPVRNAILWNDGRAADILGEWQQSGALGEIFRISGNALFPGYTLACLAWLQQHEPGALRSARHLLFCKDWIRYRLTGQIATDHSDASYMPYDIRRADYSDELLAVCGVAGTRDLFPRLLESGAVAGKLSRAAGESLGLPPGIPVVAGMVDVAATTLGAGAYRVGQACSIVGTSFLNNVLSAGPSFEPGGVGVQARTTGGLYIRSMVNTSGTINLQWFLDQLCAAEQAAAARDGGDVYAWAEQTAAGVPLGSGGIIYHPYLNTTGVISPFVNPTARAQFFGLSVEHTRAHLLRAVYEGTALSMLDSYLHMPADVREVSLSGGGARSRFWCQMFADCTGRTMLVPSGTELGARGVAILAGVAGAVYRDLADAMTQVIHVERRHEPDPGLTAQYRELYELYRQIYEHLGDDWWARHRLLARLT